MSNTPPPRPGNILTVLIEKVDWSGARARLPDGSLGIIRHKELATGYHTQDASELASPGSLAQALVLRHNQAAGLWELSQRQARAWEQAGKQLQESATVKGQVVSILEDRAYVEIIPGIDALLPADQVPLKPNQSLQDALWIDDQVVGIVTHLDPMRTQMTLSLNKYLKHIESTRSQTRDRLSALKQS